MITDNYIKMCKIAEGIQELWKPENGDWVFWKITNSIKIITDHFETPNLEDFIWLPTQEQLQKMVDWEMVSRDDIVTKLNVMASDLLSDDPILWNEFWLMIVMCEKYHKTWNGEVWEINSYWQD